MSRRFFQTDNEVAVAILTQLGQSAFVVYSILKMYAGNGSECYPSASTVAQKSGMDKVTVLRALATLRENGVISGSVQPGRVTRYMIAEPVEICNRLNSATGDNLQPVTGCNLQPDQLQNSTGPVANCNPNNTQEQDSRIREDAHATLRKEIDESDFTGKRPAKPEARGFVSLCRHYPRIENRKRAQDEWDAIRPDSQMLTEITIGFKWWQKNVPKDKFPDLFYWLKDHRWQDRPDFSKDTRVPQERKAPEIVVPESYRLRHAEMCK